MLVLKKMIRFVCARLLLGGCITLLLISEAWARTVYCSFEHTYSVPEGTEAPETEPRSEWKTYHFSVPLELTDAGFDEVVLPSEEVPAFPAIGYEARIIYLDGKRLVRLCSLPAESDSICSEQGGSWEQLGETGEDEAPTLMPSDKEKVSLFCELKVDT